jgi:hypothetical protein
MIFRHVVITVVTAAALGCSGSNRDAVPTSPTGPSLLAPPLGIGGGVSRPATVTFPARPDTLDFRQQLETKYATGLRRPVTQTIVDMEGEATWIGEYDRYRVNGCDHDTATRNVMTQIDGGAPPQVCAIRFFPENAIYPAREQVVDFRRQLGSKYQSLGRTAQSAVDPEGAAIWIAEYLRYRTSGCDHATAVQNVMTQVDGNPAPASCVVACAYYTETPMSVPAAGGTFSAHLRRTSGSCDWVAQSEASWIRMTPPITGTDRSSASYLVEANSTGAGRTGWIRFVYAGGITYLQVDQGSLLYNIAFQLFDPAVSTTTATTECQVRTTSTICTLTATVNPAAPAGTTYDWRVEYPYGGTKVKTQAGALPTFSFTESCGTSADGGSPIPLTVKLTVRDAAGNSATLNSGQGSQPALQLRTFSCQ